MIIRGLSLKNFKCFEQVDVDFGKITLLLGANSSGKSSLLNAILVAFQSNAFPLEFNYNDKYVDLGDFKEIVYNHDENKLVEISLNIREFKDDRALRKLVFKDNFVKEASTNLYNIDLNKNKIITLNKEYKKIYSDIFARPFESDIKNKDFDNVDELFYLENILWKAYTNKFNFISSYRLFPERTYYQKNQRTVEIQKFGENYLEQIRNWKLNKYDKFRELVAVLRDLNLLHNLKLNEIQGGRYELRVKPKRGNSYSALSDVGFGISQFLPIVVADLQLGEKSTLAVSQPEIHLHPNIQANFSDYMVKNVLESNKNYIIETHSEHILNRLRLNIVEGKINTEDVKVYYFENDGSKSNITEIKLTKNGRIENAPKDFFNTYMMDVMNIAAKAME